MSETTTPLTGTIEVKPMTADHIEQLTVWLGEHGEDANHIARFVDFNRDGTITLRRYKMRATPAGELRRYIEVRAGEEVAAYDEVTVTPKSPFPVYPVHLGVE